MSKGDKQRPGTGYADGWSRIFEKSELEQQREKYKNLVVREMLDAMPVAKTYNMIRPIITGTCGECKYLGYSAASPLHKACKNILVADMITSDGWAALRPPADFGCIKWEWK